MYRKAIVAGTAIALAIGAGIANAQNIEPGWYGGVDLGRSRLGMSGGDFDSALSRQGISSSSSSDRGDTAYGVNAGYRFHRNFALEGAYAHLGEFGYSATTATDTIQGTYKANAYSLSAVGIMPLQDNWSVYGKAGLAHTRAELGASSASGATAVSGSSHSENGLLVGAGVSYDFTRTLFAKGGWDRYTRVGNDDTGKGAVDVFSVGIGARF